MKEIKDLHYRVVDKGLFLPIALRLARDARKVSYWTPSERAFPTVKDCIGDGFPGIERVECYLEDMADVDCWVFPDVGFAGIQRQLAESGLPVWGAFDGSELEVMRGKFLDTLSRTGLPVPKYERAKGITELRDLLRNSEDRWVKISRFRGDLETFHWRSREEDETALDLYATRLGPFREEIVFYVFEPIEAKVEDGCDTWCIDGQFPQIIIHGMEAKDKAYLGTFQRYEDLPEEVRQASDAFGPILGEYGYRSFFSTEVRITEDGESYFIDPTCRAGSPPSQVMAEMIGNYAEIIWGGANGKLVEPEPAAFFGAQAIVSVKSTHLPWKTVKVDSELDRWLKCSNCMRSGDVIAWPAESDSTGDYARWITGIGDTPGEAIRHLQHNVKLLPDNASCDLSVIADLIREIEEAEKAGMEWTDQPMPPPEIAVKD
jgi:hypothetical protein